VFPFHWIYRLKKLDDFEKTQYCIDWLEYENQPEEDETSQPEPEPLVPDLAVVLAQQLETLKKVVDSQAEMLDKSTYSTDVVIIIYFHCGFPRLLLISY